MPIPSNSKYVNRISVPIYSHRCWNLFTLQLQITRVDPFNNGSCHSNDSLEDFSVYKEKTKGSKYSVQVCFLFSKSLLYIFRILKPRANGHNIVGRQLPTLLDVTCCARLHILLHVVACCWELLRKVWNRSNFQLRTIGRSNSQHCCTLNQKDLF